MTACHPVCLCVGRLPRRRRRSRRSSGCATVEPLSGAAISVPAFTLLFLLLSPLLLAGEPVVWRGVPIFVAIGLVFPALLTLLTFASNRALGPVVTSTLGNLAPLFAVATGRHRAARAAAAAAIRWPRDRGGRRGDHHRDAPARLRQLAELGPAAAAWQRGVARRGAAGRQARARDLAQPALGLPDRLHHVVAGRADRSAHPQGQLRRRKRRGRAGSGSR